MQRDHETKKNEPSSEGDDGVFAPGHILGGKYKVISILGKGGMGTVYKALQVFLNKEFAVKVLDSRRVSDDVQVRRFQMEAKAAHSLNNASLVKVHDFGLLDNNQPYLVMDLVEGTTLAEYIRVHKTISIDQCTAIFTQVCLGLAYAHNQSVVHRDIKPSNIMIVKNVAQGSEGSIKILDFGIAKIASDEAGEIQQLTRTGEVFGSPLYMSPEQCTGDLIDHRSDIYSLGCVIFESLTGTPPHLGANPLRTMMMHQSEPAPLLKEASLGHEFPQSLERMVGKMLQKAPHDRYQNLSQVIDALNSTCVDGKIGEPSASSTRRLPKQAKIISMPASRLYGMIVTSVILSAIATTLISYELAKRNASKQEVVPLQAPATVSIASPNGLQTSQDLAEYFDADKAAQVKITEPINSVIVDTAKGKVRRFHFPHVAVGKISTHAAAALQNKGVYYKEWMAKDSVDVPVDTPLSFIIDGRYFLAGFVQPAIIQHVNPSEFTELMITGSPMNESTNEARILSTLLRAASKWTNLKSIILNSLDVNDDTRVLVDQMENVQYVTLEGKVIPQFSNMNHTFWTRLKSLALTNNPITAHPPEQILSNLIGSPNLEKIVFDHTPFSYSTLEQLNSCPHLTFVGINNDVISDQLAKVLCKMPKLQILRLKNVVVTPDQFKMFAGTPTFRHIYIDAIAVPNLRTSQCNDIRVQALREEL